MLEKNIDGYFANIEVLYMHLFKQLACNLKHIYGCTQYVASLALACELETTKSNINSFPTICTSRIGEQ